MKAHAQCAAAAFTPARQEKFQRRPAVREANALEWCQLIKTGGDDGDSGDNRTSPVPCEPRNVEQSNEAVDAIRREAKGGPRSEVAEDENPGRHEDGLAPLGAFAGNTREGQYHRCDRGQHHRRHHWSPHADEPAELTQIGSWSGDHATHQINRGRKGEQPDAEERRGQRPCPDRSRISQPALRPRDCRASRGSCSRGSSSNRMSPGPRI